MMVIPDRVRGDEPLRKGDELGAVSACFSDQIAGFSGRFFAIEKKIGKSEFFIIFFEIRFFCALYTLVFFFVNSR